MPTAWLDDPARVWPVLVDPTFQYERAGYDDAYNYKSDGTVVRGGPMRVGSIGDGTSWRSVTHFVYANAVGWDVQVVDVEATFQRSSGDTTTRSLYLNHATQFGYNGIGTELPPPGSPATRTCATVG
ncbi:hypothetical protein HJG43_14115 [Kineosporiaceae bacterium SCSIO 59966]|nr:hypothetical protein HJG43_14115 [Kineosporiaceae bacterium SCSIO 59966]